jgi:hypothetical protein
MDGPLVWVVGRDPEMRCLSGPNLNRQGLRNLESPAFDERGLAPGQPSAVIMEVDPSLGPQWGTIQALRRTESPKEGPLILIAATTSTASELAALAPVLGAHSPLDVEELLALVWQSLSFDAGVASSLWPTQGRGHGPAAR